MKNIFLAATLAITAVSAILIVAHAQQGLVKKNYSEWDPDYNTGININHSTADIILIHR